MKLCHSFMVISFIVVTLRGGALGVCSKATVERIKQFWGGKAPQNVLDQSVGIYTYMYLSPQFNGAHSRQVYCVATKLERDQRTGMNSLATDLYIFKGMKDVRRISYHKFEYNGVITLKADGETDEHQLIVSFKNHVLLFWQCLPLDQTGQYDSLVGIAVDVNYVDDHAARAEVEEAKRTLESLGLATGRDVGPCAPDTLRHVNEL